MGHQPERQQIFLLKGVAHWSSQSFHWLIWKKWHLLCSTLKKKDQILNLWKTKKACFLRRGSFFLSRYVFFLNSCSLEIQSTKVSSLSLCVSSCPQHQLNSLEDLQSFARNNGVPQGIWVPQCNCRTVEQIPLCFSYGSYTRESYLAIEFLNNHANRK